MRDVDVSRIGLVVHPSRPINGPLRAVSEWAAERGAAVGQISIPGQHRRVAEECAAGDCDVVVAIGGDGTALAAIRAAAAAGRPVLPVSCGSLGVLAAISASSVTAALDRFIEGKWEPRKLPALDVAAEDGERMLAFNDIVVVRGGQGQLRVTALLDGAVFDRFAGDGCIVSTAMGSSAYALAAGGPLLAPGTDAFVLTTLPTHGGSHPPLVVAAHSALELETIAGHGGARLEVDGQVTDVRVGRLTVGLRHAVATLVAFPDQEPFLQVLRQRRIVVDSPRIVVEEGRG
jgi:NAD+ kinase